MEKVIFVDPETKENIEFFVVEETQINGTKYLLVAKNRHGETGKVELRWMPDYTTFGTLEHRYGDEE